MVNKTDIKQIRSVSKSLLYAVDIECDNPFGIVQHPFTNTLFTMSQDGKLINLQENDNESTWKKELSEKIDSFDLVRIYMLINKPWRITWLKYVESYLSDKDFAEYLADAYVSEEMPNLNPNIKPTEIVKWFKRADKRILMDDEEYDKWSNLSDTVTVYRGVSHNGTENGISWTTNYDTAKWFADRFSTDEHRARIYQADIPKEHCLCCFDCRGEHEIIVDIKSIKDRIIQIA